MSNVEDCRRRIIFIFAEGNIGATKSTFIQCIRERLAERLAPHRLVVVPEPIEAWRHVGGADGPNALDALYKNRGAFLFQVHAMSTRVAAVRDAIAAELASSSATVDLYVLCERSVYTDRHIFVEMLARTGQLDALEYAVYRVAFDYFTSYAYPASHARVLYLYSEPRACAARIQERNRNEETGITLEYLEALHAQHEAALATTPNAWNGAPVCRLNVETMVDLRRERADDIVTQLLAFMVPTNEDAVPV
jgi:deoxyadenosine/deoxycytidine kinase